MEMEMYGNGMEMYLNPIHNSRTRGVSSKQMLVRVSRKTYEYCCLRRDDVHVINLLRTVILLSPPLNPKQGLLEDGERENDLTAFVFD